MKSPTIYDTTHGYVTTSHASQGTTVNKVFIAIDRESMKATDQRTAYVAVTRGKEQAVVFTDNHLELLKAAQRADRTFTATELADLPAKPEPSPAEVFANRRLGRHQSTAPDMALSAPSQEMTPNREHDHAR